MAQRDWRQLVDQWSASRPGRMNVRLLVHLSFRMDMVDEQNIGAEVLREKRQAYEDELTIQAANVGCNRRGVMDNTTLKEASDQSKAEGVGIVNTYNYDLANAINTIHDKYPTANRNTYAKYLGQWHNARADWKNVQISLHNRMEWKSKAITDFTRFNNIQGYAQLVPSSHASCDICKGWIRRGKVPLQEAQKVIEDWPPHLNCIHSWVVKPIGDMRCEDLWVGAEPAGYSVNKEIGNGNDNVDRPHLDDPVPAGANLRTRIRVRLIGEKGSAKSGNYGHAGRRGKVGGSAPSTANMQIPPDKVPDTVYVGLLKDWYYGFEGMSRKPVKDVGLMPGPKSQFKHSANRRDSVYVSASASLAATYAGLYSNPIVLSVDVAKLDKGKFYYDPLDIGTLDDPIQMAYRGAIPPEAISVHSGA